MTGPRLLPGTSDVRVLAYHAVAMDIDLSRFTEDELVDLSRRIADCIRFLRQTRCQETMLAFRIGDRVSFTPECGHEVIGTVVRFNRKSVTVACADGHQWRVAPTILRSVAGEADRGAKTPGTLISLVGRRGRGEA